MSTAGIPRVSTDRIPHAAVAGWEQFRFARASGLFIAQHPTLKCGLSHFLLSWEWRCLRTASAITFLGVTSISRWPFP